MARNPASRDRHGPARGTAGPRPWDLHFTEVARRREFALLAPGQERLVDGFTHGAAPYRVLAVPGRGVDRSQASVEGDGATLSVGAYRAATLLRSDASQEAPFATVWVSIAGFAGCRGRHDTVYAGLVRDADHYLLAWYNRARGRAGIDLASGGGVDTLVRVRVRVRHGRPDPRALAFTLTGMTAAVWAEDRDGIRPLATADLTGRLDLRRPATCAAYRYGFGARACSGAVRLAGVRAGHFGQVGLRDPHLVTHADGTPYQRDGSVYLTFTHAGAGFFASAHWGVWRLRLDTLSLEHTGSLYVRRLGSDLVLGDHAGHVVWDGPGDRWLVATSTWGDFDHDEVGVGLAVLPGSEDPLHGVHTLRTRPLGLPTAGLPTRAVAQWDPHLARIDGRWHVAFVNARRFFSFYPALARGPQGGGLEDLALVGSDHRKPQTEGVVLAQFGEDWFVLASNGDASPRRIRQQFPVYDLRMRPAGTLDAPHPTNIPWPTVFRDPIREGRWLMVTFDGAAPHQRVLGYGGHGQVRVLAAGAR